MYWKIFLHSSTIWYFHVPDICKRLRVRCACSISFWLCSSGSEVVNSCTVLTFLKNKNNNCYDGVLDSTLLLVLFAINVNLLSERLFFCEDRAEQVIIIIVIIFSLVYSILCIHWLKQYRHFIKWCSGNSVLRLQKATLQLMVHFMLHYSFTSVFRMWLRS